MMEGHTSLKLLRHQDLPKLVSSIQEKASKFGLSSLIFHYADLLQCQTSFTFTDSGITLFVHTPAHVDNTMLTIMEHVPFPIRVDANYFAERSTNLRHVINVEPSSSASTTTYMQAILPHRRHAVPKEVREINDELDSINDDSWLHHKAGFLTSAVGIAWTLIIGTVIIGVCVCLRLRARRAVDQVPAAQPAFNNLPVIPHGQPVQVVVNNDTMHMQQQPQPAPCAPQKPS